jgi:uncharacterized membrane protein YbhN (UPF0104 family)
LQVAGFDRDTVEVERMRWVGRYWLQLAGLAALAIVVIAVNPGQLVAVFAKTNLLVAASMVPVVLGAYIGRGVAWWVILRRVGVGLSLWRTLQIEFAGQLFVLVPTGDFARIPMVKAKQTTKTPAGEIAGTIVIQEIMLNAMFSLGLFLRAAVQPNTVVLLVLAALLQTTIFVFLLWDRAFVTVIKQARRIPIVEKVVPQLNDVKTGVSKAISAKTLILVCVINVVVVGLTFYLFHLAVAAVGAHISFAEAGYILAIAHLASLISLIPGGTGIFEGLATVLLVGNGIPVAVGVAGALLYRFYNDVLMGLTGLVAGLGLGGPRGGTSGLQSERKVS